MINQLHPDLEVCKCDLKGLWTWLFYFTYCYSVEHIKLYYVGTEVVVILAKYLQFVS